MRNYGWATPDFGIGIGGCPKKGTEMEHTMCGNCNTVSCECDPYDPSGDMLEKMHEDDAAFREADKDRFTDEQRASALATAQAYTDKHPSPHAARDKTEEWDMNERNQCIKDSKQDTQLQKCIDELQAEKDRRDAELKRVADSVKAQIEKNIVERLGQEKIGEAQNIMDGGCVQEGFPTGHEPNPLDLPEVWPTPPPPSAPPTLLSVKDTNPKDAVGIKKWRQYCTVPTTIIWELGVAMLEGARKYGRHNYRVAGVRASVYVDAAKGHIDQWWEGEDLDTDSKLNHIVKAMASLAVLRDAMIQNKWVDDRPPKTDLDKLRAELQEAVDGIFERIPEAKDAYLEGDQYDA